jgi:hypothetical protein
MRADIEQLERYAERDRGDYTGKPKDPIVAEPVDRPDPIGQTGEGIMQLFAKYEAENPNSIRPETFRQARRDVQHFADFVGSRVRVSMIDKRMVREWKEVLAERPVKATETSVQGFEHPRGCRQEQDPGRAKPTLTRNTIRAISRALAASAGGWRRMTISP